MVHPGCTLTLLLFLRPGMPGRRRPRGEALSTRKDKRRAFVTEPSQTRKSLLCVAAVAARGESAMRKLAETVICIGIVVVVWGVWRQNYEEVTAGLLGIALGLAWDFAHERRLTGAQLLERWVPSAGKLRIAGYALAVFAALTAFGVWQGSVPAAMVAIMLGLIVAAPLLAAPFVYFHRRSAAKAKAAEDWPQVMGRVETSFMSQAAAWPAPIVTYRYEVDGRRHHGSRVRFGGTGAMNPTDAEQVLATYYKGAEVPVYYDPERPGRSVLLHGEAAANKGLMWGAGCMAATPLLGAAVIGLFVLLGLLDAALTAIVGHRVLP